VGLNSPLDAPPAALAFSQLPVVYSASPNCSVVGNTLIYLAVGSCTLRADQPGDSTWAAAAPITKSITVVKGDQSIAFVWSDTAAAPGGTSPIGATASSSLPVTFTSSTTSVCTVPTGPNVATVSYLTGGTCTIRASQGGDQNWNAAVSVDQSVTIRSSQTLTFVNPPAVGQVTGIEGSAITLSATASATPVVFTTTTPSICSTTGTNGATLTYLAAGTCTVAANQAGNAAYFAAPTVSRDITILGKQTITFTPVPPTPANAGTSETLSATVTSGLAVTFGTSTPLVCSVTGTNVDYIAVGTCTITATQGGNATWAAAPQATSAVAVRDLPAAPSSLTGSGSAQMVLTWTAAADNNSPITNYIVQYRRGSSATWLTLTGTRTTTTATVTGLLPGVTYVFQVAATNAVGTGPYSDPFSKAPTGACVVLPQVTITGAGASPQTEPVLPADLAGGKVTAAARASATTTGTVARTSPTSENVRWSGYTGTQTWTGTYSYTATGCTGTRASNPLTISSN
jgi:hypothetical protein